MISRLGRPHRIGVLAVDFLEALGGGLVFLLARGHRGRGCRGPRQAARHSSCLRPTTSRSRQARATPGRAPVRRAHREPYLKPLSTCPSVKLLRRRVISRRGEKKRGRAAPRKMRGERQNLRQLAWRRRNAGICRSSSSRAGLARSVTSRLIDAWAGAGRGAALGATATTFSAAGRAAGGSAAGATGGAIGGVAAWASRRRR